MPYQYLRRGKRLETGRGYKKQSGFSFVDNYFNKLDWVDSRTTGDNIPNWRWLISHHLNATTLLIGELKHAKVIPGYYAYTYYHKAERDYYTYWHSGLMGYHPDFPNANFLSTTKADNAAKVRFVKRAQDAIRHLQGSVALGELRETLSMIRNPAKSFRLGLDDYMRTVKKRAASKRQPGSRRPTANQLRRMLADSWLEYAFGWTPLINDVKTGAETLARREIELRREYVLVKSGGSDETSTSSAPVQCVYQYVVSYAYPRTVSSVNIRYYGQVKREVYNDYKWDMNLFGFNPNDFVPTLWELIPYSFLVDYFTNIGDIINTYSYNKVGLAWCNRAEKKSAVLSAKYWFNENYSRQQIGNLPAFYTWIGDIRSDPSIELKHVTVKRDKFTGSFVPTIEFSIPGMGTKWINLSALALGHADARRAIARRG